MFPYMMYGTMMLYALTLHKRLQFKTFYRAPSLMYAVYAAIYVLLQAPLHNLPQGELALCQSNTYIHGSCTTVSNTSHDGLKVLYQR